LDKEIHRLISQTTRQIVKDRYTDTERRINEANDRLRELNLPTLGEHTEFFKLLRHVDKMLEEAEKSNAHPLPR
jgi:hypothetical protein